MVRRDRTDPQTARLVEERLQWLLSENGPDAAGVTPPIGSPPARRPSLRRAEPHPDDEAPAESSAPVDTRRPEADTTRAADRSGHDRERSPARPPARSTPLLAAVAGFRRPHLVIVAGIVALGILFAGWAVLRARPVAVAVTPPPVTASPVGTEPKAADDPTPGATAPPVVVHVLGAVEKPGLVTLPPGSRVQDALDSAGGLTSKAAPGELNLAQPVADGQQIVVGTKDKPNGEVRDGSAGGGSGAASGPAASGGPGGAGQPVNLNSATQAQLEELPGVGPVMAGKIIAWRAEHGRFSRVEELQEIDGVGPKTYAKLAPLCRV